MSVTDYVHAFQSGNCVLFIFFDFADTATWIVSTCFLSPRYPAMLCYVVNCVILFRCELSPRHIPFYCSTQLIHHPRTGRTTTKLVNEWASNSSHCLVNVYPVSRIWSDTTFLNLARPQYDSYVFHDALRRPPQRHAHQLPGANRKVSLHLIL